MKRGRYEPRTGGVMNRGRYENAPVGATVKWNKFGLVSFRQVGVIEKLKKLGLVSLKNGMNWGWCLLGRLVPSKN